MADFCWGCTEEIFGEEYAPKNDMRGLCAETEIVQVLCEGCSGMIWVDHEGRRYEPKEGSDDHQANPP